jgi:surface polysaccharide O-acyltransferase-like enzyme
MAESKKNQPCAFWIDAVRSIGHRLSLPTMALCACYFRYFIIIKHIPLKQKAERIFYNFAEHSFGIYLLHIYIIRHGLWPLFQEWALPTAVAIPMLVITGAAASYLAVALLSHLPKSKYIVGI